MATTYFDLISYLYERQQNRLLTSNLFWFKKNKGYKWIRGQNFGDYLSYIIVAKIAEKLGFKKMCINGNKKLLAVGSVLHFAKDGDVVWGAGVNGKVDITMHKFTNLDVRMVRGPLTKKFLENRDILAGGNVFGDPALLLPILFPKYIYKPVSGKITVIPNLNETDICKKNIPKNMTYVSPFLHWKKVLKEILSSQLVLSSSLHGIILSEAFGVPVRLIKPVGGETLFKYKDYYEGTGRVLNTTPSSFADKINYKSGVEMSSPIYDADALCTRQKL